MIGRSMDFILRPLSPAERAWQADFLRQQWGDVVMVSRGRLWDLTQLPGFAAWWGEMGIGLATYRLEGEACELTSLNSLFPGNGVGSALLQAVYQTAKEAGCRRLWLITTNDNTHALRFYQKRGFRIAAVHVGAVDCVSRRLKPAIPPTGYDGIPIRDEIELEIALDERQPGGGKSVLE